MTSHDRDQPVTFPAILVCQKGNYPDLQSLFLSLPNLDGTNDPCGYVKHLYTGAKVDGTARNRKGRVDGTDRALRRHAQVRGSRPILGDDATPFSGYHALFQWFLSE